MDVDSLFGGQTKAGEMDLQFIMQTTVVLIVEAFSSNNTGLPSASLRVGISESRDSVEFFTNKKCDWTFICLLELIVQKHSRVRFLKDDVEYTFCITAISEIKRK